MNTVVFDSSLCLWLISSLSALPEAHRESVDFYIFKYDYKQSQFILRQCSYWAQFELVVDWGLQARGREGEHRRLKVFGVEGSGKVIGKKGSGLRDTGRGRFRCGSMNRCIGQHLGLKLKQLTHETEVW